MRHRGQGFVIILVLLGGIFVESLSTVQGSNLPIVNEHVICRDVVEGKTAPFGHYCVQPSTIFAASDTRVTSFLQLSDVLGDHNVTWRWLDPDGRLYHDGHEENTLLHSPAKQDWIAWTSIEVAGQYPSSHLGNWSVEIYVDGVHATTDAFRISTRSPLDVSILPISRQPDLNMAYDPIWNNATLVDIPNWPNPGSGSIYANQTGYAYAHLGYDDQWLYGNVEYYPPPDLKGGRTPKPKFLIVNLDPNGDKSYLPSADDYRLTLIPDRATGAYHGLFLSQGGSQVGCGGWGPSPCGFHPEGRQVFNDTLAYFTFHFDQTPTIPTPHPIYTFRISRNRILTHDGFGLYFLIGDGHMVTIDSFYVASFPQYFYYADLNGSWTPSVFASAFFAKIPPSTNTTTVTATTMSGDIHTLTASTGTSLVVSNISGRDNTSESNLERTIMTAGLVAILLGVGILAYRHKRKLGSSKSQLQGFNSSG